MNNLIALITALVMTINGAPHQPPAISDAQISPQVIAQHQISLSNRYPSESVNEVMKKNILLNLTYFSGSISKKSDIDWEKIASPFYFEKTLLPQQTFAYHSTVKPEYVSSIAFTTNSSFNADQGYLNDGYLYGDGVCHLASLINWAAQDAGLATQVPKDHRSVGEIPQIPDQYGVSIYTNPATGLGANNNLYITNTQNNPITFHFDYDGTNLTVYITV